MLKIARTGTAAHVEQIVGAWRRVDRKAEAEESARQLRGRGLQVFTDDDGMTVIRGRLTPEVGAVLLRALEAARERHQELDPGAPGGRYQVVVHADAAVLADPDQPGQAAFEDGVRASSEAARRHACIPSWLGEPLDVRYAIDVLHPRAGPRQA